MSEFEPWWRRGELAAKNPKPDWAKGDYEPNARVGESPKAKAYLAAVKPQVLKPRTVFDRWGILIKRQIHNRFAALETLIVVSAPWKVTRITNIPSRPIIYRPRLVVAFGSNPLAFGGWHARGGVDREWIQPRGDWI